MIVRDSYNIIVQHRPEDKTYSDAGDSASRTGIMALCGSVLDQDNMNSWTHLCRHPYDPEWSDESKMSRDQLVCFAAGITESPIQWSLLVDIQKLGWFINKDFLSPSVKLYLNKCTNKKSPWWLEILGRANMFVDLIWNTKIKPDGEINQFACMCIVMGPWWSRKLMEWHPCDYANLLIYWGGWRDQIEISTRLTRTLANTGYR
jgi:hypothetical protein